MNKSRKFKTLEFKRLLYSIIQFLLFVLIVAKPAFSQTKIDDKIIWVKPSRSIVNDLDKTEVKKGAKLVILHDGENDPLLASINTLRSKYELIFHNYKANDEVNNLEMFRKIMGVLEMNILIHSNNPDLAIEYFKEYPSNVNLIILHGKATPKID